MLKIVEIYNKINNSTYVVKIRPYLRNKYVLTIIAFILWITFIDENNLIKRFSMNSELKEIEKSKSFFKEKIEKDKYEMEELENNEKLERLAREKYLMRKNDEDVFLMIIEED